MMYPRELTLVRHGESTGNVARRASFRDDDSHFTDEFRRTYNRHWPLTEKGIKQAETAGSWLRENGYGTFDTYVVSPYVRTRQTAAHLGLPEAAWMMHRLVRERDEISIDRLPNAEISVLHPDTHERYIEPIYWRPPNGEAMTDLELRVRLFFSELWQLGHRDRIIIVAHSRTMWTMRMLFEGLRSHEVRDKCFGKDRREHIQNGRIIQYRRAEDELHYTETRSVNAENLSQSYLDWRRLTPRFYSNEALLEEISLEPIS